MYRLSQRTLAEVISAFEVMDEEGLILSKLAAQLPNPFPTTMRRGGGGSSDREAKGGYAVLIELRGSNEAHDMEKLEQFGALVAEKMPESTISLAQTESQLRSIWQLREGLPVKLAQAGTIYKLDFCLPLDKCFVAVDQGRQFLRDAGIPSHIDPISGACSGVIATGFGHFGDGNIHLNFIDVDRKHHDAIQGVLNRLYDLVSEYRGSMSAEHGLGSLKLKRFIALKESAANHSLLKVMRNMKQALDPNGILNPGKVVPPAPFAPPPSDPSASS